MAKRVLFLKAVKNAVLLLALVFVVFPVKNTLAGNQYFPSPYGKYSLLFNQAKLFSPQLLSAQYLNALKPFQKGFSESLKPGITLNTVALTLLKPNLTFNDMESLFKKQETSNPICFSQGGARTFPPGRVFSAPLCWDTGEAGCSSCACQCGYTGYIWDPATSLCGCAE